MMDTDTEAHRRACEARKWLREGYVTDAKVNELMERISGKRGSTAANALREEMRLQWKSRTTWWEGAPL
jgi:ribosomal protein S21